MSSHSDMRETKVALALLKQHRASITLHQFQTIRGQIKAGRIDEGLDGLAKILRRKNKREI